MGLFSTEKIFGIKIRESANDGSDFGTPDADYRFLFFGEDGHIHNKDASAVVRYPPGAELDYVEFTSGVNLTATTEGAANTIVTGTAITYNGSIAVVIEFYCPYLTCAAGNTSVHLVLYDGAASIGLIALETQEGASNNQRQAIRVARKLTPSAAAHTYSIRGYTTSGTAVAGAGIGGSGAYMPGFIRILAA